jgi:hypothetical protein
LTPKPSKQGEIDKDRTKPEPGVFFSANVYHGVPDLTEGKVK